jgi:hypothetical protein
MHLYLTQATLSDELNECKVDSESYVSLVSKAYCGAAKGRFGKKLTEYKDEEALRDHLGRSILSTCGRYELPDAIPLTDFGLMFNGEFVTPLARRLCSFWVQDKLTKTPLYRHLTQTVLCC